MPIPRRTAAIAVEVSVPAFGIWFAAIAATVRADGIFLSTFREVPSGMRVEVEIALPDGPPAKVSGRHRVRRARRRHARAHRRVRSEDPRSARVGNPLARGLISVRADCVAAYARIAKWLNHSITLPSRKFAGDPSCRPVARFVRRFQSEGGDAGAGNGLGSHGRRFGRVRVRGV
jgi:hypothetical protein